MDYGVKERIKEKRLRMGKRKEEKEIDGDWGKEKEIRKEIENGVKERAGEWGKGKEKKKRRCRMGKRKRIKVRRKGKK